MNRRSLITSLLSILAFPFARKSQATHVSRPEILSIGMTKTVDPFKRYPWLREYGLSFLDPVLDLEKLGKYDERHGTHSRVEIARPSSYTTDTVDTLNVVTGEYKVLIRDEYGRLYHGDGHMYESDQRKEPNYQLFLHRSSRMEHNIAAIDRSTLEGAGWESPYYATPEYRLVSRLDGIFNDLAWDSHSLNNKCYQIWELAGLKGDGNDFHVHGPAGLCGPPGPRGPIGPPGPDENGQYPTPHEWMVQYIAQFPEDVRRILARHTGQRRFIAQYEAGGTKLPS